ncbi:hypothetical protein D3C73_1202260 [compost metagenome]
MPHLLRHTYCGHAHCQPLQAAQALTQQKHAQQHVHQRIDEIAQAGLEHAPVIDRPYVSQPVAGNQGATEGKNGQAAGVVAQLAPPPWVLPHQQQQRTEQSGPEHPVHDDLNRRDTLYGFEIEGEQAPDDVGREAKNVPATRVCGVHAESLLR